MTDTTDSAPQIFISYSHKDFEWKERLYSHLSVLLEPSRISIWDDRQIKVEEEWKSQMETSLSTCRIAILLLSANFLSSEFILQEEIPKLLQRYQKEGLWIYPVIVKPCLWERVDWIKRLQVHPWEGKSLSGKTEIQIEEDLMGMAKEIGSRLDEIKAGTISSKQVPSSPVSFPLDSFLNVTIQCIKIKNIRCFKNVTFQQKEKGENLVLIGSNARGKTTILQLLALALGLIEDVPYPYNWKQVVLTGEKVGLFEVDLLLEQKPVRICLEVDITDQIRILEGKEILEQKKKQLLLCGYGANRSVKLEDPKPHPKLETVATLFGENGFLKHIKASKTYIQVKNCFTQLRELINEVFLHSEVKPNIQLIDYDNESFMFADILHPKREFPLESLSEGFKATFAWVFDLCMRIVERGGSLQFAHRIGGIILVDELDLHLHPSWQRTILDSLEQVFPQLQFIVTTHSPFVVQSSKERTILYLSSDEKSGYAQAEQQIVESELSYEEVGLKLFALPSLFSHKTEKKLNRFREIKKAIYQKEKLDEEEFFSLVKEIAEQGVELEGVMRREIKMLEKKTGKNWGIWKK